MILALSGVGGLSLSAYGSRLAVGDYRGANNATGVHCSVSISLMEHTGREHIGDNLHGSVPYGYFGYSLALYLMMV